MPKNDYYRLPTLHPYPIHGFYIPRKEAWEQVLKDFKVPPEVGGPFPTGYAGKCTLIQHSSHNDLCLVTIETHFNKVPVSPSSIVSTVAHEATHVVDFTLDAMGEQGKPSMEFHAYTLGGIVTDILDSMKAARQLDLDGPRRKKR